MATKPTWLNVSPMSGSGNDTLSNSASAHTGRTARTGTVTVTGSGVTPPSTYRVIQSPLAEYVSFDNGTEMAANKTAGTLTITGKSNSSKLTFSWAKDSPTDVVIPTSYSANGVSTSNGVSIDGDPGAENEYAFSLALSIPLNDTIEEITRTLIVTADGGQTAQIAIKQAAGDARLSLNTEEITIPQDGSAVSVTVSSNTSWTVS